MKPIFDTSSAYPAIFAICMAAAPLQRLCNSALQTGLRRSKQFRMKDIHKQEKVSLHLQKAISYTILFSLMASFGRQAIDAWGAQADWTLEKYQFLGPVLAILPAMYAFELTYSTVRWDEWLHHGAAIAIGIVNVSSRQLLPQSDAVVLAGWCYTVVLAVSTDIPFYFCLSWYHFTDSASKKVHLVTWALITHIVNDLLVDAAVLATVLSHRHLISTTELYYVLCIFPCLIVPAQVMTVRALLGIRRRNVKRSTSQDNAPNTDAPEPSPSQPKSLVVFAVGHPEPIPQLNPPLSPLNHICLPHSTSSSQAGKETASNTSGMGDESV